MSLISTIQKAVTRIGFDEHWYLIVLGALVGAGGRPVPQALAFTAPVEFVDLAIMGPAEEPPLVVSVSGSSRPVG